MTSGERERSEKLCSIKSENEYVRLLFRAIAGAGVTLMLILIVNDHADCQMIKHIKSRNHVLTYIRRTFPTFFILLLNHVCHVNPTCFHRCYIARDRQTRSPSKPVNLTFLGEFIVWEKKGQ